MGEVSRLRKLIRELDSRCNMVLSILDNQENMHVSKIEGALQWIENEMKSAVDLIAEQQQTVRAAAAVRDERDGA